MTKAKDKKIVMTKIQLDFNDNIIDCIIKFALEKIKSDREALINYGVNEILKEIIKNEKNNEK